MRQSPNLKALPDEEVARSQNLALRRLNQVLDALKESQENPTPLSRGSPSGEDGDNPGGSGSGSGGDDSLPPLAQLKLLRSMQKEINERTEAFKKKHPVAAKLLPKEKIELQDIRREQKEVADLLEQLNRPPGEDPDEEEKAKEKDVKEGEKQ